MSQVVIVIVKEVASIDEAKILVNDIKTQSKSASDSNVTATYQEALS